MQKTVIVGLSGGVDSSVAAYLLKQQGYNVIGLHMRGENPETREADEKRVDELCAELKIKCVVVDYKDHMQKVKDYFINEYLSGRTPNPCVICNKEVKFKPFLEYVEKLGADYFATGHYARITEKNGIYTLQKGVDEKKDQSYFLYRLSQQQLAKTLFPLGEYTKEQVRQMARERQLAVAEKTDSQDFYAGNYADLLEQKPQTGNIVHVTGRVLGQHQGFWNYTIGQRKGLGIAHPSPLFVVDIDAERNQVIVGESVCTLCSRARIGSIVYGGGRIKIFEPLPVYVKYRSAGKMVEATILPNGSDELFIHFDEPQRSVTRGQSLVCYDKADGISVVCGGIIL